MDLVLVDEQGEHPLRVKDIANLLARRLAGDLRALGVSRRRGSAAPLDDRYCCLSKSS